MGSLPVASPWPQVHAEFDAREHNLPVLKRLSRAASDVRVCVRARACIKGLGDRRGFVYVVFFRLSFPNFSRRGAVIDKSFTKA